MKRSRVRDSPSSEAWIGTADGGERLSHHPVTTELPRGKRMASAEVARQASRSA